MKKILFVCSSGGHWVQMTRIMKDMDLADKLVFIASTNDSASFMDRKVHKIPDFNKDKIYRTVVGSFKIFRYVLSIKPQVALSTGAAPGLMALFAVKLLGGKTIWVDSIANTERLSLSGRIAKTFCTTILTQWPHLADEKKVVYKGRVI